MEMHEIRYFLAACQTLNFRQAADLVHITQPALTRAIQKLEAELGGLLFHRDKSHVQLSDFGRLMRSHLDEIAQRSEHAKRTARSFLSLETAPVTLGVMCTIGPLRFIGFLNAFRERFPGIEVTVIEGAADHLTDLLLKGKLDIALLARPEPFDPRLKAEPVYAERFGLAFSTGHPFETRNTLQLADVRSEPYLERINCEYGNHIDEPLPKSRLRDQERLPKRARGLDPGHGRCRNGCLLHRRILREPARRLPPARRRSRDRARGLAGFRRRPPALARHLGICQSGDGV